MPAIPAEWRDTGAIGAQSSHENPSLKGELTGTNSTIVKAEPSYAGCQRSPGPGIASLDSSTHAIDGGIKPRAGMRNAS